MVDEKVAPIDGSEVNWAFQYLNMNKKGLALNLKTDPGRDVLNRLIQRTDIFITNYETLTLKTLKADYETLVRFKPDLIYGLLTGFGTEGPDRSERGFDYSAGWARSGAMRMVGEPGSISPPVKFCQNPSSVRTPAPLRSDNRRRRHSWTWAIAGKVLPD